MAKCDRCGTETGRKKKRTINATEFILCNQCAMEQDATVNKRRWAMSKNKSIKEKLFSLFDSCKKCGTRSNLTIDHVNPICMGGGDELENLTVLCDKCNKSKGGRV